MEGLTVKRLSVLVTAVALAGCASTAGAPSLSYTFQAPRDAVKFAIVAVYSADGFSVYRDSDFQIAMERYRGGAALRHAFSVVGSSPTTVTATISIANGAGQTTDFTNDTGARSLVDGYMIQVRSTLQ